MGATRPLHEGTQGRIQVLTLSGTFPDRFFDEAAALWTRALALRRTALAADPKNVRAASGVVAVLAGALVELADTHVPASRPLVNEARTLFRSIPRGDIESTGAINATRDFRQAYERLAGRLGRR